MKVMMLAALGVGLGAHAAEPLDVPPAWQALLHYRAQDHGTWLSEADRPGFFLTREGKHAPQAELDAALSSIASNATRRDFACRYPARFEWLRQRAGQDAAFDVLEQCPELAAWFARFQGRRISINFASGYLESPSSSFGHTFLKIYRNEPGELLSPTINYAARTQAHDGDLDFIFKGLFGGFPGVADELPFYRRLRTYTETEGRDIHEYELDLTPDEVRRLLLHTWEIKDGVFDYYFLRENCAYRTLSLLDVARPQARLLAGFSRVTVPTDTLRALRHAGMLGRRTVWPALPKQVRHAEQQVDAQEAALARGLASGRVPVATLAPPSRAAVLQLGYEYASVLIDRDAGERGARKDILGRITAARLELGQPDVLSAPDVPPSPEQGHDGGLLAVGALREDGRTGVSIQVAAFQHTLTAPLAGYEPHAELAILDADLRLQAGRGPRLQRMNWLVAQSSVPSSALFAPRAWRFQLSTADRPFADRRHMATQVSYQLGRAISVGRNTVLSVLPGVSVEAARPFRHQLATAAVASVALTRQGQQWGAQVQVDAEKFILGSSLLRRTVRAVGQVGLSRNAALVLTASRTGAPRPSNQLMIALQWRQPSLGSYRPAYRPNSDQG
ncbi:MAG: DUF4105 domain-containing protein [Gammaproteobacteria bacterium]